MPKHAGMWGCLISAPAVFLTAGRAASAREALPAGLTGMADSFKEIANLLEGINTFLSGISFISETIGFFTIILFIAVLVFSAGYSAAGVPRGKASYLAALVTADALWVLWKASFGAPPADYLPAMARANGIVIAPMAAAALLARFSPVLTGRIRRAARSLFRKKRAMRRQQLLDLYGKYEAHGARLNGTIMADVLDAGGADTVTLSPETRMNIKALRRTLSEMDPGGGREPRD